MTEINLRHGIFLPPFHPNEENPTQCLERDLELIQHLDKLGFQEAWIGEHHSAGYEIISSPEIFIAFAAERTKHIRLGTGVISLPYHHPMMTADRIVQLDHMTRGRVMFGCGPGLLASDAVMMGIDPMTQRDRMAQAIDVIIRLFNGEIVTEQTDWYTMNAARLHLLPYTKPYPEMAVVSSITPSGGRLAGKYDLSMICVAATNPFGYDALASNWEIANGIAAEHGRRMDANRLRLVGPMHIAETREQAMKNAQWGFDRYLGYLNNNQPRFNVPAGQNKLEWFIENKFGVCGTPDDAIALIERLQAKQGEFGAFLHQAHNWADFEATKRSYELYARYVMPHFSKLNQSRAASYEWCGDNRTEFSAKRNAAAKAMFDKHEAEQQQRREPTDTGTGMARPTRGREAW
ncbi:MAG TPA: LLM class flavin-dependent oxidoreductase [Stellaceae bacterium]|jgi:limonene 1,2-monooxygenase|nr:LLM class flavin-dependent oxidoreductase [Stellaceae bacterium]